jgi:hypothetical protein
MLTDLSDHPVSPFNLSTHLKGYLNFHSCAPVAHILPANLFSRLTPTAYNGLSLRVLLIPLSQLPIACSDQVVSRLIHWGTLSHFVHSAVFRRPFREFIPPLIFGYLFSSR